MRFARIVVKPHRSISLPTPVHRHKAPAMDRERVTALCAPSARAAVTAGPRPVAAENMREAVIIPNQIQLIAIVQPPSAEQYAIINWKCMCKSNKMRQSLQKLLTKYLYAYYNIDKFINTIFLSVDK
jgi:hypothetical protein